MEKELKRQLVGKGIYFTHLVEELFSLFCKSRKPLSVEYILSNFAEKEFFPNKTSLYRQLTKFTDLGIFEETIFSDGIKRYCLMYDKGHHHHFECSKCGYIESVPMSVCNDILNIASKKLSESGHNLQSHSFTFKGLCSKCI